MPSASAKHRLSRRWSVSAAVFAMSANVLWAQSIRCEVDQRVDFGTVGSIGSVFQTSAPDSPPWIVETAAEQQRHIGPALQAGEGIAVYGWGFVVPAVETTMIGPAQYRRVTNPQALYNPGTYGVWIGWSNGYAHTGNKQDYFLMFDSDASTPGGGPVYRLPLPSLKAGETYDLSWWYANVFKDGAQRAALLEFSVTDAAGVALDANWVHATGLLAHSPYLNDDGTAPRPIGWLQQQFAITPTTDLAGAYFQVSSLGTSPTAAPLSYGADFALDDIEIRGECAAVPVAPAVPVPVSSLGALLGLGSLLAAVAGVTAMTRRRRTVV